MKKKVSKLFAVLLSLSMVLSACNSNAPETTTPQNTTNPGIEENVGTVDNTVDNTVDIGNAEQVFNWNVVTEPKTLDPGLNSAVDGSHLITNIYEGLYRNKGNGLEPAMAENYDVSNDGLTYTFHLRDANWSDGVAVTARDFEFAWKRAVEPATASEYGYIFFPVKNGTLINDSTPNGDGTYSDSDGNIVLNEEGNPLSIDDFGIVAEDDKTLVVTLETPSAFFLDLTDFPTYRPLREDVVGDDISGAWAKDPTKMVSNGPFYLSNYTVGDSLTLTKNTEYWNASSVNLETVNCRFITDASTALTAFRAGEIHFSEQFPVEEMTSLVRSGEAQILDYIGTYFYILNTETEALKDINVRKALSLAINRTDTTTIIGAGFVPATGFVPYGFSTPSGEDFRDVAGDYGISLESNPEEALRLLEEAGYTVTDGKVQDFPTLEILINSGSNHEDVAQIVQNDLRAIGIEIDVTLQEWAVMQTTRMALDYDGIARHGWIGDYLDPQTFLDIFITGNPQSANGYSNPEYDEIVRSAMRTTGDERYDYWLQAEKILMEDGYVVPVAYYALPSLISDEFEGWYMKPTGKLWVGDAYMTE